ncbi:hypothetical protein [Streptomyces sp. JJ66]|nr:hypothetical protein [Streptomyces sp. JJ66]
MGPPLAAGGVALDGQEPVHVVLVGDAVALQEILQVPGLPQ